MAPTPIDGAPAAGPGLAVRSALGALGDVFAGPLFPMLALCVATAVAIGGAAVWAALTFIPPLIPAGTGWLAYADEAGTVLTGVAAVLLAFVLMAPVSIVTANVLFDVVAERVERTRLAPAPVGTGMAPLKSLSAGLKIGGLALLLNVLAIPLYFIPVVNLVTFWCLNGFLMGREYFLLAALRYRDWDAAQALRARYPVTVFVGGLACAVCLTVPFLNLAGALFAIATMARLHRTLSDRVSA
jgi:CysZ protein